MYRKPVFLRILCSIFCIVGMLCLCCACSSSVSVPGDPAENAQDATDPVTDEGAEDKTETSDDLATYRVTDMQGEMGLDFMIDFPAGKDLTILQITDTQMQTMSGVRNETRRIQVGNAFFSSLPDDFEFRVWRYMDEAVEKAKPDLIVLTGDNIYGELDDSGEMWLALIEKMDRYGVPWFTVFGNHDNESGKGVAWQVEQLEASEYCIFRQGGVSGNSNYNLLIRQGGEPKFLLYMMDSNGCTTKPNNPGEGMMPDNVDIDKIEQTAGFRTDQVTWMTDSAKSIRGTYGKVPVLIFYHIPVYESVKAAYKIYPSASSSMPFTPDQEGDLGMATEALVGVSSSRFWKSAKNIGCTGMFVGHQHKVATSIVCEGIRVTYGLKTSTYDYHDTELLGATKITLAEMGSEFAVEYLYTELSY